MLHCDVTVVCYVCNIGACVLHTEFYFPPIATLCSFHWANDQYLTASSPSRTNRTAHTGVSPRIRPTKSILTIFFI